MGQSTPAAASYLESAAAGALAVQTLAWFCTAAWLDLSPPLTFRLREDFCLEVAHRSKLPCSFEPDGFLDFCAFAPHTSSGTLFGSSTEGGRSNLMMRSVLVSGVSSSPASSKSIPDSNRCHMITWPRTVLFVSRRFFPDNKASG